MSCGLPSQEGTPWSIPRRTAEGNLRAMLLGDWRATIYLSCGREDRPGYFRPADQDAILFLIGCHVDPLGILGCTKYCKDGRENTWNTSRHLIVVDCREQTNQPMHYSKISCVGVHFVIAGSISKHQGYIPGDALPAPFTYVGKSYSESVHIIYS